jgi:hypothetical protein
LDSFFIIFNSLKLKSENETTSTLSSPDESRAEKDFIIMLVLVTRCAASFVPALSPRAASSVAALSPYAAAAVHQAHLRTGPVLAMAEAASASSGSAASAPTAAFFEMFQALDAAFSAFDLDGDGTITVAEIGDAMKKLGHNPSEDTLKKIVAEFDENSNGTIDFDEFCDLMTRSNGGLASSSDVVEGVAQVRSAALGADASPGDTHLS